MILVIDDDDDTRSCVGNAETNRARLYPQAVPDPIFPQTPVDNSTYQILRICQSCRMHKFEPLPAKVTHLADAQEGLITHSQAISGGVSASKITRLLQAGIWIRLAHGVYDTNPIPVQERADQPKYHQHRRLRAAMLGLLVGGPTAVAYGQCALVFHQLMGIPIAIPSEVMVPNPHHRKSVAGVRFHLTEWAEHTTNLPADNGSEGSGRTDNVANWYGPWRYAPVKLAMAQAVVAMDRVSAVAVLDSAFQKQLLQPSDIPMLQKLISGRPGATRALPWLHLADGRSESPLETKARLDCLDGGVAPDFLQREIWTADGQFIARIDMGWDIPGNRILALEVDGVSIHSDPAALFRDRERSNELQTQGVVILRVTAKDLRTPGLVAATVRRALLSHGRTSPAQSPSEVPFPT